MPFSPTPGTWEASPLSTSGWIDIFTRDANNQKSLPFIACKHHDQTSNARLIIHAKDLLEILTLAEKAFAQLLSQRGLPREHYDLLTQIHALLEKVTGDSQ